MLLFLRTRMGHQSRVLNPTDSPFLYSLGSPLDVFMICSCTVLAASGARLDNAPVPRLKVKPMSARIPRLSGRGFN